MLFKDKIRRILPSYAVIPLISAFILNLAVYMGAEPIAGGLKHWDISCRLDNKIPLIPFFVIFYVLAYVQWAVGYVVICRESRETCFRVMTAEMTAKLICFVLFIAFPTTVCNEFINARQTVSSDSGFFGALTGLIYSVDTPNNLFPSIHCLESWACFRGALGLKKVPRWYAPFMLVFAVLVFMSTVFIKQHVLADIPAGILVFEIGLIIVKKTKADAVFDRLLYKSAHSEKNI